MTKKTTRQTVIVLAAASVVCLVVASRALADSIWAWRTQAEVGQGNPPAYRGAIQKVADGGLVLKWELGNQDKPFHFRVIQRIAVDSLPALGEADEAFVAGDHKQAISKYGAAMLRASKPWMKEYINARLVQSYEKSNQFSRAVKAYIELCQSNSSLMTSISSPEVPAKGSADNATARRDVEAALAASPGGACADHLKRLRMNILLVEGNPAEVLPVIEAELKSEDPEVRQQARIKQIELLLKMGRIEEMTKSVAEARKELDPSFEPQLLYFEGQILYAQKDFLHAALSFMRVPILYSRSSRDLAADSLYWAAQSMQQAGTPVDEVAVPLQEAIQKYEGTDGATKSEAMLKKLSGK